jgi:hypothetical protein
MLHETESGLIQQGEVDRRCFRYIPFRVELWEEAFICAGLLGYEDHQTPTAIRAGFNVP